MKANIIKDVYRFEQVEVIRDEKHAESLQRFGAIVEYGDMKIFVDLDDKADEERFEKFIAEEDMNSRFVIENTLQEEFACSDCDEDYHYTKGGKRI